MELTYALRPAPGAARHCVVTVTALTKQDQATGPPDRTYVAPSPETSCLLMLPAVAVVGCVVPCVATYCPVEIRLAGAAPLFAASTTAPVFPTTLDVTNHGVVFAVFPG